MKIKRETINISRVSMERILRKGGKDKADLLSMYTFYCYTGFWQGTTKPRCTNNFVGKALGWSEGKLLRVRRKLKNLNLIKPKVTRDIKTKKITGHYVIIHYFTLAKNQTTEKRGSGTKKPDPRICQSWQNRGINAYNSKKENSSYYNCCDSAATDGCDTKKKKKTQKKKTTKKPSAKDRVKDFIPLAVQLADTVKEHKNIKTPKTKISKWANSIRLLCEADGVDMQRISSALDWYQNHSEDDYVPVIESGQTLRRKFVSLESAIKRAGGQRSSAKRKSFSKYRARDHLGRKIDDKKK